MTDHSEPPTEQRIVENGPSPRPAYEAGNDTPSAARASVRLPNGIAGREFRAAVDIGQWLDDAQDLSSGDVEQLRALGLTGLLEKQTLTVSGIAEIAGDHH